MTTADNWQRGRTWIEQRNHERAVEGRWNIFGVVAFFLLAAEFGYVLAGYAVTW